MKFWKILLLAPLFVGACAFHHQPFVTFTATNRPISDTAVFSTGGMKGNALGQISAVDGVPTSCWQVGCPGWVRVAPGRHTFSVKFNIFNNGITSHLSGETIVLVPDMQAKHVYEANFEVAADKKSFKAAPIDLGENPDYGFIVSGQYHRAQF